MGLLIFLLILFVSLIALNITGLVLIAWNHLIPYVKKFILGEK
jgi:hypothetical protein